MQIDDRSAMLWWAVPAAAILILAALTIVLGKPPEEAKRATSYDASPQGFRAAYLLLEELKYPVERSKRPTGGGARLVLFPNTAQNKAPLLDSWIRAGGVVILATDNEEFAKQLGIHVRIHKSAADPGEEAVSGAGITQLAGGKDFVEWPGQSGQVWLYAGEKPVLTIYPHERGEIWLLNRPELFSNRQLPRAENALLLCRLATEVLQRRSGKMAFDEYFHGMQERPGVLELLLQPPTLWITLQGVLLLGLLLWRNVPRFGNLRTVPVARRRSKEEFLDAMAALLERKGDCADAYATAWQDLTRAMETTLGLPAGRPVEEILQEAERRRSARLGAFRRLLSAGVRTHAANKTAFVKALNELQSAREEFFHGRHDR